MFAVARQFSGDPRLSLHVHAREGYKALYFAKTRRRWVQRGRIAGMFAICAHARGVDRNCASHFYALFQMEHAPVLMYMCVCHIPPICSRASLAVPDRVMLPYVCMYMSCVCLCSESAHFRRASFKAFILNAAKRFLSQKDKQGSPAERLTLKLEGRIETFAEYKPFFSKYTFRATGKWEVISHTIDLASFAGNAPHGNHSFPFSVRLPPDVPASMQVRRKACSYTIKSGIDCCVMGNQERAQFPVCGR